MSCGIYIKYLREDKELIKYKEEWKKIFKAPFPLYNDDCYEGLSGYKQKIKEALETGDYTIGDGNINGRYI